MFREPIRCESPRGRILWAASISIWAVIGYSNTGLGCSLSFTQPERGSTVTTATVGVAGTGSGSANPGDFGTVTATVNGQVFFSQSGTFTALIQFFGSGGASVVLKPGANVLQVSGSAGGCSASDSMVVYYTPPPPPEQKAAGAPLVCNGSNPIDGANGNKFQSERDYTGAGPFPLVFERYYNSRFDANRTLGRRWQHSYDRRIAVADSTAYALRPDGRALRFDWSGSTWTADADVVERLTRLQDDSGDPAGWRFVGSDDSVELFDRSGRLTSITLRGGLSQGLTYDAVGRLESVEEVPFGRRLQFAYDASGRLISLTDPGDGVTLFDYDTGGRLATVTYPDGTPDDHSDNPRRHYLYEDARFPQALTGLIDENGIRFASWAYDAAGRALSSEHAGGVDHFSITYDAHGNSTVTDPLGTARTYAYETLLGIPRATGVSRPCSGGCGAESAFTAYDASGNVASTTDFNGIASSHVHDLVRNLELSRVEAVGTAEQRSTTTQWHSDFRVPTRITEAGQTISLGYDAAGRLISTAVTAGSTTRKWRFAYNSTGQLARADGPRTSVQDVTRFYYYAPDVTCPNGHATGCRGQIASVRNAKGHLTKFSHYDAHGRLGRLSDPNGLFTHFAYDARGRLKRTTVNGGVTNYAYDKVGSLLRVTSPTGTFVELKYDTAGRLTGISDRAGNRAEYALDAAGHRLREDFYDVGNNKVRERRWVYDALSRIVAEIGGSNQTTSFTYDAAGNPVSVVDPAGRAWSYAYDALNRLVAAEDPSGGLTTYRYDSRDRPLEIVDAEGLRTTYSYSGFGDLLRRVSPDTGTTRYTYDLLGNPLTRTDASGVTARYSYDALNRPTAIDYPGTDADVAYVWDTGTRQKGFLKVARRGTQSVELSWTRRGKLASMQHSSAGVPHPGGPVRYAYNKNDQLVSVSFGDARDVLYTYNGNGAIGGIRAVDHSTPGDASGDIVRTVASAITRLPFGPVKSLIYGNTLKLQRSFDLDYRLTRQTVGNLQKLEFSYDTAGNIASITNQLNPGGGHSYIYDVLDRLAASSGPFGTASYSYDAVGNRLSELLDGKTTTSVYEPGRHRLTATNGDRVRAFSYSASGNTVTDGEHLFSYGSDGRLDHVHRGATMIAAYGYDAFGQRVEKTTDGPPRHFEYDQGGRLLRETGREYVWLDGELVALLDGSNLNFVHVNQLGAPVIVTNAGRRPVWRATYEPFGKAALTNPALTLNVRLPGQYLDTETGLHYNYFRDYDPSLGRYLQSDPIGLAGGMSTYAYAANNPINSVDPTGEHPLAAAILAWRGWGIIRALMPMVDLAMMAGDDVPGLGGVTVRCSDKAKGAFGRYLRAVERLNVRTPHNSAVFYSGVGNRALAESFAKENGRLTLEMTSGGKWLDSRALFGAESPLTIPQAVQVWSRLSQRFAAESSGTAVGFVKGARPGGIFNTVEYPELVKNSSIVNVVTGGH